MEKKLSMQEKIRRGKMKKKRVMHLSRQSVQPVRDRKWYKKKPAQQESSLKKRILLLLGIVLLCGNIGILTYHPFFQVNSIQSSGFQRVDQQDFDQTVKNIMNYKRFFVFPASNYFFVYTQEIEDILLNRYPLVSVTIQKQFPNTIQIKIEEKISTIIYDDGESYSSIDLYGKIIEPLQTVGEDEWTILTEVVTSTDPETGDVIEETLEVERYHTPNYRALRDKVGDYPLVYDTDPSETDKKIPEETLRDIIDWYYFFDRELGLKLNYVEMGESPYHAKLYSSAGWYAEVSFVEPVSAQQAIIQEVLTTQIANQAFQYMDVRFLDKVFWK